MRKKGLETFRRTKSGNGATRRQLLGGVAAAAALGVGRADAQTAEAAWYERLPGFGPPISALEPRPHVEAEELRDLRPDSTPWRSDETIGRMDQAIERFQAIAANGGWPTIPGNRALRPGDDDERVALLKKRLAIGGDLKVPSGGYITETYDGRTEEAVRAFQERCGLRTTGRADQPTLAQLNVSAAARVEQLRLNQRRLREMLTGRIEERYVLVNTAAFQLEAVEGYDVRRRHRTIVGKPDRQTPSVKATIRAFNFFPYWHVPDSVATLDLIPRLQKEPEYLAQQQIRAYTANGTEIDTRSFDWSRADGTRMRFRQDPGPQNALGLVRIDMPNEHIVYMHDTPMKPLFGQRQRAFSAGCVRVQDVFDLVDWIGRFEPGWDRPGRAAEIAAAGMPKDITLTRPVPVYFTYITAWAEADGKGEFRPDIYGRDGVRELVGERDPEAPPAPRDLAP